MEIPSQKHDHLLELGLDTFGDVTDDAQGHLLFQPEVLRNIVAEAVLADKVGIDFFGIGEHHREDFGVSAPDVVRRLTTTVTSSTKSIADRSLHHFFYIGVWLKGMQGILEALGGALLWFLNPKVLHDVGALFVKHELSEYPQNFIVRFIHHVAAHWSLSTQHFGAIYLLIRRRSAKTGGRGELLPARRDATQTIKFDGKLNQ